MSLTSNSSYSTTMGAAISGMFLLYEEVLTDSTRDYNIYELVASQPKMINATFDRNSIIQNLDIDKGVESEGPDHALDVLNS